MRKKILFATILSVFFFGAASFTLAACPTDPVCVAPELCAIPGAPSNAGGQCYNSTCTTTNDCIRYFGSNYECVSSECTSLSVTLPNPLCFFNGGAPTECAGGNNPACDNGAYSPAYPDLASCCIAQGTTVDNTRTSPCITSFPGLITQVATYVTDIVGVLAIMVLLWAGILFITSMGNPSKIDKAKHAAIYAAIGLAVTLGGMAVIALIRSLTTV